MAQESYTLQLGGKMLNLREPGKEKEGEDG